MTAPVSDNLSRHQHSNFKQLIQSARPRVDCWNKSVYSGRHSDNTPVRKIVIDDDRTQSPWAKSTVGLRKEPEIGTTEWIPYSIITKKNRDLTPNQAKAKKY